MKALTVSAALLFLAVTTVGCGQDGEPRAQATDACFPVTDVRSFRESAARVDAADLSAADKDSGRMAGGDDRSFVARAGAAELTAAGIDNLAAVPDARELLLFVNHGSWNRDEVFAYSGGLDTAERPSHRLVPPTITWVVNVVDPWTHRVLEQVTSPRADRSVCFRG